MRTRSDIIVQRRDGKFARIYCHLDGSVKSNGKTLYESYQDIEKAEELVALGDLSSLGKEIGCKHDFDWRMNLYRRDSKKNPEDDPRAKMCNFYGRDSGEEDVGARVFYSLNDAWPETETGTEFTYVFADLDDGKGQRWLVGDPDEGAQTLRDLGMVLRGEEPEPATAIKAGGGNLVIGRRKAR